MLEVPEGQDAPITKDQSLEDWSTGAPNPRKAAVSKDAPLQEGESIGDWLIRGAQGEVSSAPFAVNEGLKIPPEKAARILKAQEQSKFSYDFINRHLDEVEKEIERTGFNVDRLQRESPLTWQFLAENPPRIGLFKSKDIQNLGDLENLFARGTQPAALKAQSDESLMQQAQALAEETGQAQFDAEKQADLLAPVTMEGMPIIRSTAKTVEEKKQQIVTGEFQRLKNLETFISNSNPVGFTEQLGHTLGENPFAPVPFLSHVIPLGENVNLIAAANRYDAGDASKQDIRALKEYARLQLAIQYRGTDVGGKIAETALGILPFAGEVAVTAGAGAMGKRLVLGGVEEASAGLLSRVLAKVVGSAVQLAPAGLTAIPAAASQRMLPKTDLTLDDKGNFNLSLAPGESLPEAAAKATFSRYADQLAADLFALRFTKGNATLPDFKQSIVKEGLLEAGKFQGMGELSSALKSIPWGDARIQEWQVPVILRAMNGDPQAQQELIASTVVGGVMGAYGGMKTNREIERSRVQADRENLIHYNDMLGTAGETLKGMDATAKAPGEVEKALQAQLAEDPNRLSYVNAHEFEHLYLQRGEDPYAVAADLTGKSDALKEALALGPGGELQIPTSAVISKISATDQAALFQGKIRPDPTMGTLPGLDQHLAELDRQMEQEREAARIQKENAAAATAAEKPAPEAPSLEEQFTKQAEAAGRPKLEASAFGKIMDAVYKTLGMKGKTTPEALIEKYGPVMQAGTEAEAKQAAGLQQPAYHGSPHKFEKFDLQKIGSGEGHQAYGWGLYFSGAKAVATEYRRRLAGAGEPQRLLLNGKNPWDAVPTGNDLYRGVLELTGRNYYNPEKVDAVARIKEDLTKHRDAIIAETARRRQEGQPVFEMNLERLKDIEAALKLFDKFKVEVKPENKPGRLYHVDIPEDSDYLDYDKTMLQQSPKVQEALAKIDDPVVNVWRTNGTWEHVTGEQLYQILSDHAGSNAKEGAKLASGKLASLGIPGLKYLDQFSRGAGEGTSNYVLFDDRLAKITAYEQPGYELLPNGAYVPRELTGDKAVITMFPTANPSTIGHEPGHLFLDMLRDISRNPEVDPQLKRDFQTFLDWRKIESPEAWDKLSFEERRPHHEAWAEAYEQWLWEGKSPSKKLQPVFDRFTQWLSAIYDRLVGKGIQIPEPIRQVFERLHAADQDIQEAKLRFGRLEPFLEDSKNVTLTPAERRKLADLERMADAAGKEQVYSQALSDIREEQSAQYAKAKEIIRQEVTQEFQATKEAKALSYLKDWTKPDGSPLEEGTPLYKLSKADTERDNPGLDLKPLKGMFDSDYKEDNGLSPDAMASTLGFSSGKELIANLINTKPEEWIKRETDARASANLVDPMTDLPEEAKRAIHGDAQQMLNVYGMEWLLRNKLPEYQDALKKITDPVRYLKDVRAFADKKIAARETYNSLDARVYEKAELEARKAAREDLFKGNFKGAFAFKEKETLNHAFYEAAVDAKEKAEKDARYAKSFEEIDKRRMLGKADNGSLELADNITGQYEFRNVSQAIQDSRAMMVDYAGKMEASGEDLGEHFSDPQFMRDAGGRTNWKDLKLGDLSMLRDVLTHIETAARATNKLIHLDRAIAFDGVRQEFKNLLLEMKDQGITPSRSAARGMPLYKLKKFGQKIDASLLKLEQMVREADGGDFEGPFHKYIMYGAADAQARELDYRKEVDAAIAHGIESLPKEIRNRMSERIALPGRRIITRWDTLGFGAQAGNASNWQKFLKGESMRRGGFTEAEISKFLYDLTKEEKDFIQHLWDLKEPVWKEAKGLYKELTGLGPDEVERGIQHPAFEGYRGGHMPVIYEASGSRQGELQKENMIGDTTKLGYRSATISSGYTKGRLEGFSAPMDTDLHHLPLYMGQIIKDLTHRKWMLDVNKILGDKELKPLFQERLGEAKYNRIREVVKEIVNDRNQSSLQSLSGWRRFMMGLRLNMATAAIGFKIPTLLHHVTSIEGAIGEVGPTYMARGLKETVTNRSEAYQKMIQESGEMRHFAASGDVAVKDIYEMTAGDTGKIAQMRRAAAHLIGMANMERAFPTYYAAKFKALDTLPDHVQGEAREKLAIRAAEETVRLTIGAGAAKDRAAVMSYGNDLIKMITMYYTPGSTLYNRIHDTITGFRRSGDVPQLISRVMWTGIIAAVTQQLVAGHPPDPDHQEDWTSWFLKNEFTYPLTSVPLLRELGDLIRTGRVSGNANPIVKDAEQLLHVGKAFGKAYDGEIGLGRLAEETARSAQWFLGVPTDQLFTTGDYFYDLANGDTNPNDFWEFWKNLQRYHRKN